LRLIASDCSPDQERLALVGETTPIALPLSASVSV
jgi:hypothetical protein